MNGGMSAIGTNRTSPLHCTCPLLTQSGHYAVKALLALLNC